MGELFPVIEIAVLLAAALVGGMIAHRLRQPMILGYLVVGVFIGPYALGWVTDLELVNTTATIGVALLMFTLGLEVSVTQLKQVGKVGILGGIVQILLTLLVGFLVGITVFQWSAAQSILFGLIISLSSTAVCFKLLTERGELSSVHGRIMIAMLIIQDIAVVVMTMIVPLMTGSVDNVLLALLVAAGKALLFIGIAIISGLWILPFLMEKIGGVRSQELFLLMVIVLGLGMALATEVVGLSTVFGAFLIGLILRETKFAHQALAAITPLRDMFATLFFVSLGMMLDPSFVVEEWALILGMVAIIVAIKIIVVATIVWAFGYSSRIAILSGAGLLQIGEFGFILAKAGSDGGLITSQFYLLIIASVIFTMIITPLSLNLATRLSARMKHLPPPKLATVSRAVTENSEKALTTQNPEQSKGNSRVVVAGYGRIGQNVARGLKEAGVPHIVIDIDPERIVDARTAGESRIYGDASNPHVLSQVDLIKTKTLVVTFPDPIAVITAVKAALEINPNLHIIARVHRIKEMEILKGLGVTELVSPEYEASREFVRKITAAPEQDEAKIRSEQELVKLSLNEEV